MDEVSETHIWIIGGVIISLVLGFFYFSTAEATEQAVVGNIVVEMKPNEGGGHERVVISYDRASSTADLSGWRITNGSRALYEFPETILAGGDSVVLCAKSAVVAEDTTCGEQRLAGDDQFLDAYGRIVLENARGVEMIDLPYTNPMPGQPVYGDIGYTTEVYARGEKVLTCVQKARGLKPERMSVQELVQNYDLLRYTDIMIAPGFYYKDREGEVAYFPGVDWPTKRAVLDNRCRPVQE